MSETELTFAEVQDAVRFIPAGRTGTIPPSSIRVTTRERPSVDVDDAYCAAVNRRNLIDHQLYQCSMVANDAIHGSVKACSAMRGELCDKPADHHDFVSPGFESPRPSPVVAVPS